jgi:hypothetical protein
MLMLVKSERRAGSFSTAHMIASASLIRIGISVSRGRWARKRAEAVSARRRRLCRPAPQEPELATATG